MATHHANATGTLEVLQAARRAGNIHVIVASSSSAYGANPELPKRETMRTVPMQAAQAGCPPSRPVAAIPRSSRSITS